MSRKKSFLTVIGLAAGAWAAARFIRRRQIESRIGMLEGKVVLITGASRGIGEALALTFARRGANVVLAARSETALNRIASTCETINPQIETLVIPTDVTDEAQLRRLVAETESRFGRIDILVNNAGVLPSGSFVETEPGEMERTLELNLAVPIRLAQLVLPGMLARGEGTIVNVASQAGRHGMPFLAVYDATKGGLISFSEGLRRELDGTGVHVVVVLPGYTETDMVSELTDVYREIRLGKLVSPHDVARQTVDALLTGQPEVHVGTLESFGGYASVLAPRLADLYWRVFAPRQTLEAAARRQAEKYRAG